MPDAEGFLLLVDAEPELMPPARAFDSDADMGSAITQRARDEAHSCLRCGKAAVIAYVAHAESGPRWLDLCADCGCDVLDALTRMERFAGPPGAGWGPDDEDICRPVELPGGEMIRVHGAEPMTDRGAAALAEVVAVARRLMPEPDAGAGELFDRLDRGRQRRAILLRQVAREAGVQPSVLTRLANGAMPGEENREKLELWLARGESDD